MLTTVEIYILQKIKNKPNLLMAIITSLKNTVITCISKYDNPILYEFMKSVMNIKYRIYDNNNNNSNEIEYPGKNDSTKVIFERLKRYHLVRLEKYKVQIDTSEVDLQKYKKELHLSLDIYLDSFPRIKNAPCTLHAFLRKANENVKIQESYDNYRNITSDIRKTLGNYENFIGMTTLLVSKLLSNTKSGLLKNVYSDYIDFKNNAIKVDKERFLDLNPKGFRLLKSNESGHLIYIGNDGKVYSNTDSYDSMEDYLSDYEDCNYTSFFIPQQLRASN